MGKVIPTTSFRRAQNPDPRVVDAFVNLDDAPGNTPLSEVLPPPVVAPMNPPMLTSSAVDTTVSAPPPDATAADDRAPRANASRWRRKTLRRADGRELRKQTFYLDAELSHRLMVACASAQYELSEAIEEAVHVWLQSR